MFCRVVVFLSMVSVCLANAQVEEGMRVPKAMQGAEIIDKLGVKLNTNLSFTDSNGRLTPLSVFFNEQEQIPSIVIVGYYGCPMLCSMVSNAVVKSMGEMSLELGKDYRVLSFSIDPKETAELAYAKRKSHLKALSREEGAWEFFTGDEKSIAELTQTLGFGYNYDAASGEFAHGAGIFVLTPRGVLSRTLWGIVYQPLDLKLALVEAANGKVGSVVDRILLSCFHYVPDKHKYGLYVFGAMRVGAALTVLFLGSMLGWYWFSERRRRTRES